MDEIVQFDFPTDSPKIIKVIGVGGGGGNAVNHMYREGIHDVRSLQHGQPGISRITRPGETATGP